jgi:hypothetical protein
MGSGGGVFEGEQRANATVAPRQSLRLRLAWHWIFGVHLSIITFV